ncbi:hypothetical protein Psch_03975 [Pelotomaculum schinkii]|uniref:Putative zinc-finger domain-containing protein n=1 Tax=Pelotomaculum schinkii TaxID=78350 RepID=A0A4Y7R6L1_9FIRM|nr:zf-HC2 domain-containing protein [Pelotomaculum schinkii]TEB04250.1 hypothetical protein Psch_03975 [Pelotomaculum schinkii]
MDCRTAERLISLQPDGQLTQAESFELAAHIANCRTCAYEHLLQERLSRTLREIGRAEIEAPVELRSSVMNRLKQERRSLLKYIPAAWRKSVAAAAALLFIAGSSAGVTAGIWRMVGDGGKMVVLEPSPPAVSADDGGEHVVPGNPDEAAGAGTGGAVDSPGVLQDGGASGSSPGDIHESEAGGTEAGPPAGAPGKTEVAQSAPGGEFEFCHESMKVTKTSLMLTVNDIDSARGKAVSIADASGAASQVFSEQNNGRPVLVMRMTVASDQASGLISNLGQVGAVVDRQDESSDLTPLYNKTLIEYNDLLARQSTVQDPAEQQKMETQAASYEQQLAGWKEEAGKRVVMVRLESN